MKKGFTLLEMVIVLLVIGILMAATMRFGSGRIVDLKAQSIKEQFVGYYNDLYSQNMTSSFRDGQKYQTLTVVLTTGIYYLLDTIAQMNTRLPNMEIKNLRFET
jgi:prepilin-type N-terminal cleavage/methylation domain-containing protein